MLEVTNINIFYARIQVLWDVSLTVEEGEIVALVGANGTGKTTLVNAISGLLPLTSGRIEFQKKILNGLKPFVIVDLGISHIPEGKKLFPDMSVRENLEMGAYLRNVWDQREETMEEVFQLFPKLKTRQGQLAKTMSGGEQQMLAIGRGLMSKPKLLIIDEPSSGLAPLVVDEMFSVIQGLRSQGISIFLIEQNVQQTLEIADRAYVMENGRVTLSGESKQLLQNELIKKAYLGL